MIILESAVHERPQQHCDFFSINTASTEIYTLSLHDALPISVDVDQLATALLTPPPRDASRPQAVGDLRSEEHTSELQSQFHLVCRLLHEKKKQNRSALTLPRLTRPAHVLHLQESACECMTRN